MQHEYLEKNEQVVKALKNKGYSALQSAVVAARIPEETEAIKALSSTLKDIQHPKYLKQSDVACDRIVTAITEGQNIAVFSDYDVDGLTGGSVLLLALTKYFNCSPSNITSLIGNRHTEGYGISDKAYSKIAEAITSGTINKPDLIITVDCGSSDEERIAKLKALDIDVIVTDHHSIPKAGTPKSAFACVNPQQDGCNYKDKTIAGVTVGWLLMCLVRNKLIECEYISEQTSSLSGLLDYVSLGTVADAVSIASTTNRAIVKYGLKIMNANIRPAWQAMRKLINKEGLFSEKDLGFDIGPRINARSRMDDPYASSNYLLATNEETALHYLKILDEDNATRKKTQKEMTSIAKRCLQQSEMDNCVVVYNESFHEGVQGIVASRITEITGKPSVVFSPSSNPKEVKGSGRTVKGINLQHVFTLIESNNPGIHIKVGGHKGAFGCSIMKKDVVRYREEMNKAICKISDKNLAPYIEVDLKWSSSFGSIDNAFDELKAIGPFGREFEYPIINIQCEVVTTKVIGKENPVHAKVSLYNPETNENYDCIHFNALDKAGDSLDELYKEGDKVDAYVEIDKNIFRGRESTQLVIKDIKRSTSPSLAMT